MLCSTQRHCACEILDRRYWRVGTVAASAIGVDLDVEVDGGGVGVAVSWRVLVLGIRRADMIQRRGGLAK